jgi:hypothetical protein
VLTGAFSAFAVPIPEPGPCFYSVFGYLLLGSPSMTGTRHLMMIRLQIVAFEQHHFISLGCKAGPVKTQRVPDLGKKFNATAEVRHDPPNPPKRPENAAAISDFLSLSSR